MRASLAVLQAIGLSSLIFAFAACEDSRTNPDAPESEGPLSVLVESGASSIHAPSMTPWSGVFGDFLLCARDGEVVVLDSVDHTFDVAPKRAPQSRMRVLEADEMTSATAFGTLDDMSAGPKSLPGEFYAVEGFEVIQCSGDNPPVINELLIGLESGPEGVWVRETTINYHDSQDRSYSARIPWQMIMCGSEIKSRTEEYCP